MSGTPDLNLLPVFEALLRHGSVTRAAAQMGLTQSAMSSALGRLRRQFGDPLFVNTRAGMLPTARALELAPSLTDALATVRSAIGARETFDPRSTTRSLRVYMTDVGETVLLPSLMRHLNEHSPALRLETAQLSAAELAVRLETGDIDLAVGYVPQLPDRIRRARLFEEHYVCMTRPDHPMGRRSPLTLKEFLSARHVLIASMGSGHQILERTLAERGVLDNVALRVPHFVVVPLIVAGTDLIVSLPSRVAEASSRLVKVKVHPLPIPLPSFDVSLYWHERVENDIANQWLRNAVTELFGDRATRAAQRRRMSVAKTPVFLLTGFLGSGKTTLLNGALRAPALANTAVVVNELGEIGLDNLIIAQASDNVVLLDAGCLCCVNTGALQETLADLGGRRARGEIPAFERVIIETSGVADPAPLLNVLLGHPLVTGSYALEATVCVVDAQHFLASRARYPELDKQAAVAERIFISKFDLADPAPVVAFLKELNPGAEFVDSVADVFSVHSGYRKPFASLAFLGPIRSREHFSGIRAFAFRPPEPVTWAGWSAWSRLVAAEFGARLIRVKGLLRMDDSGEIAFVQGVQGVFHPPQRLREWPGGEAAADRGNRLVCIARDLREQDIAATLPALNAPAGTQAIYSMKELQERQARL